MSVLDDDDRPRSCCNWRRQRLLAADLLFPDPWPKSRHHKRRFVNEANLAQLHRVLKPGAVFRFASDIDT